ncbi:hypothetical protein BEP19_02395 [Ammoniphilus oxalaticus]|uniref:Uncharacterized protein n=2 Tax=Ammoniphilus oxalaticus TaxID=66863 RepID=A0A419SP47_9BACL|nr:hypothetical protein BEP19_02395 [Ammoniphilus oxalaticus]
MDEYKIGESSANDYVGRLNGILNRGIYNEEKEWNPSLKQTIEKEYENSKGHYVLTIERYIEYMGREGK